MRVKVEIVPRGPSSEVELSEGSDGLDLCRALGLQPDAYVMFLGDQPVPIDSPLSNGDDIKMVLVVSGGHH